MKTIIIEDEPLSSMYLAALLKEWCTDINLVAQARTMGEASEAIWEHKPDLLFLDIQMEEDSGLALLESMRGNFSKIIITTALAHHTTRLIQPSGVPYLQKPVDKDELVALADTVKNIPLEDFRQRAELLCTYCKENNHPASVFAASDSGVGKIIHLKDVLMIEADGEHTVFHLGAEQKAEAVNITFKLFRDLPDKTVFFSLSKSRLINLHHVLHADTSTLTVQLMGGINIPVPASVMHDLIKALYG